MAGAHATDRRGFLRALAAGAAGVAAPLVVPASALGRSGSMSPGDRILAVAIGARNRGNDLIRGVIRNKDVTLLAVCDIDEKIRAQRVGECNKSYEEQERGKNVTAGIHDFHEVMERTDIDAVLIATPDQHHAHMAIAAMRSGKDVYCEKPMTLTIAEGRAMADTAARYGRVFQVGSQRRSEERPRRACEAVRNGRIGKLLRVEVGVGMRPAKAEADVAEPVPPGFDYELWLGPAPWAPYSTKRCHYNFRFVRDYSGGEMTNFGAHFFDVAQWGIGADDTGPVEIDGKGEFFDGLWNTFSKVDVTYTYASGVTIHCTHKFAGCKFIGTEGWVDADRLVGEPMSAITAPLGASDVHLYQSRGGHMGTFIECVRTRGTTAATVEIGHRSATVCHLGNIAMTLERKLRWDPKAEEFPGDAEANRMRLRPYREPYVL
ncbi:MAG TPA: Gfo/Idh/MocA family oxidoreductase [Planctomycetota bacterium]|nr:Gfo/Idh/MocA family oxidoreductase [Planctomycetota bacterium]